ncbi:MAG: nucleotidyltransferase domain-containing protein [Pseudomonadota bacterium]
MNHLDNIDNLIKNIVSILTSNLDTSKIYLFGSRAKNKNDSNADFDFAIEALEPELSLLRYIRGEIDKIAGLYKVDLVFLENCDEDFKKIIKESGKVVYERT